MGGETISVPVFRRGLSDLFFGALFPAPVLPRRERADRLVRVGEVAERTDDPNGRNNVEGGGPRHLQPPRHRPIGLFQIEIVVALQDPARDQGPNPNHDEQYRRNFVQAGEEWVGGVGIRRHAIGPFGFGCRH